MQVPRSVVVVTGASSGIGLATARSFANAGAKVVLAARSIETLNAVAQELRQQGHEALAIATDVRDQAQVNHLIDATYEHFGQIDILTLPYQATFHRICSMFFKLGRCMWRSKRERCSRLLERLHGER